MKIIDYVILVEMDVLMKNTGFWEMHIDIYSFDKQINLHRDITSRFNIGALSQAFVHAGNRINGSNSSDSIKSPYQKTGEPIIPILFRALLLVSGVITA